LAQDRFLQAQFLQSESLFGCRIGMEQDRQFFGAAFERTICIAEFNN
jgi:hypothetical protein